MVVTNILCPLPGDDAAWGILCDLYATVHVPDHQPQFDFSRPDGCPVGCRCAVCTEACDDDLALWLQMVTTLRIVTGALAPALHLLIPIDGEAAVVIGFWISLILTTAGFWISWIESDPANPENPVNPQNPVNPENPEIPTNPENPANPVDDGRPRVFFQQTDAGCRSACVSLRRCGGVLLVSSRCSSSQRSSCRAWSRYPNCVSTGVLVYLVQPRPPTMAALSMVTPAWRSVPATL
jgi:hypothetical protein